MTDNLTVSKDKKIIDAAYSMNIVELRLLLACVSRINPLRTLSDEEEIYLTPEEYSSLFHVSLEAARNDLKKAVNSLYKRSVVVDDPFEEREFRWLNEKIIKKNDGQVGMSFNKKIIPYLTNFQNAFASYKLKEISKMQSPQSIRIYEIIIQFKQARRRVVSVEWLKKQLLLTEKYPRFYDFKKYVLMKAIEEINEHSDIHASLDYKTKKRIVTDIIFSFKFKIEPENNFKKNNKVVTITNKIIDAEAKPGEARYKVAERLVATGKFKHAKRINKKPKETTNKKSDNDEKLKALHEEMIRAENMGYYDNGNGPFSCPESTVAEENIEEMKRVVSDQ